VGYNSVAYNLGLSSFTKSKMGTTAILGKNKNCYNFAAVRDIVFFTKFDLQAGLVFPESEIVPNMTYDTKKPS